MRHRLTGPFGPFRGGLFAAWLSVVAWLSVIVMTGAATGQQVCELVADPEQPGWQVLSCRPDVSVSLGADTHYSLSDTSGNGLIDTLDLDAGAVRTRVDQTDDRTFFQIRTRQAIVSVRGTDWATAQSETGTEVFVVAGEVQVTDLAISSGVVLRPGFGVDVAAEAAAQPPADRGDEASPAPPASRGGPAESVPAEALRPVRWGAERAEALLARFPAG